MDELRALAATQDGQFALRQARALGVGAAAVRWLRDRGETTLLRPGVSRFRSAAGPADPAVTAYLACWPDAVISHASAARHHGLQRAAIPGQPHVTVPHHVRRAPAGVRVHSTRRLEAIDVLSVGGLRYTSLARTVCDLGDGADQWWTLALVDDAVALGASPRWLHQRATALAAGRSGPVVVMDATAPGAAAAFRSWLERASAHVYRVAGIPDPEWNVPVFDDRGRIGVVDALWRAWWVVSETEGLRFHTTPQRRRRDARRFNRLDEAGYTSRRFT